MKKKSFIHYQFRKLAPIIIMILIFFFNHTSFAQFYETGQDPSSIKWHQINTGNFQIIFSDDFTTEAQRLANILEYSYEYCSKTLNWQPKKVSVILHNHSVTSNGLVVWTPKRMELFTTPPQDIYPHDWLEQLAIHELRHVVQTDKMNQGITKLLSLVFGQQATGAVIGMVPRWFLEGDAINIETALSNSGRGRLPSFEMKLRALVLENKKMYSYDKATMGSYKDYVPDYYALGYQMVAYSRNKYDSKLWDNTLNFVSRNPYTFYPFYFGLKKYTGLSRSGLYRVTFNKLDSLWTIQASELKYTSYHFINKRKSKNYTSYRLPQYLNDSVIIVEKSGINQIKQFVAIDKYGNEKKFLSPGFYSSIRLSVAKDKMVWAENIPDIRWGNRSYSVIKTYNFKTLLESIITQKSRYFAPALSKDALKIVAVEVSPKNEYALVILDSETGELLQKIMSPNNHFIHIPNWTDDGNSIIVITLNQNGKSIQMVNTETLQWDTILSPSFEDISKPIQFGKFILYNATYSGIDNIYAIDTETKKRYQVTSSRYGAFDPCISPNCKYISYSDYSSKGYNVVETKINIKSWRPFEKVRNNSVKLYEEITRQEENVILTDDIPEHKYDVQSYNRIQNLFNFHSWSPFYFDYYNIKFEYPYLFPGFTLLSQNKLSTAFTSIGYAYQNQNHHIISKFIYKGLFPVFEISADYGGTPLIYGGSDSTTIPITSKDNIDLTAKIYLPLNLTNNYFIKGFNLSYQMYYQNFYYYDNFIQQYKRGMTSVVYRLYFYNFRKMSTRDILPKWGQFLDLKIFDTPFEHKNFGSITTVGATLYFPGLIKHHSLRLKGQARKQNRNKENPETYIFGGYLNFPRGYSYSIHRIHFVEEMKTFNADYIFPIIYPDLRISSLVYIKRLRASLFYDYAFGTKLIEKKKDDNNYIYHETKEYTSYGFNLIADLHVSRISLFPLNVGLRYSYLPELNKSKTELLFTIDLSEL